MKLTKSMKTVLYILLIGIIVNMLLKSYVKKEGFKGRKAIYEVIPIENGLREKLAERESQIKEELKKQDLRFLSDSALEVLERGETCFSEVYQMLI